MNKEKKLVEKIICCIESDKIIYVTKEIIKQLLPGDCIESGYEEAYYGGDHGHDPYHYFYIKRQVLETDEKYKKRIARDEELIERNKKARYEYYLKLKEEFESEEILNREKAMFFWNGLSSQQKTRLCDMYTDLIGHIRRHETLTGREIEMIWKQVKDTKDY